MEIINQFVILFALIGTGYVCKRNRLISNAMNEDLGNLILLVALPALILQSMSTFSYSPEMMREILMMLAIAPGTYFFYILLSYLIPKLLRLEGTRRDLVQFMTVFANTGFMGFPIAAAFYGSKGLLYMVLFNMFYDVFVWTFGVVVLERPLRASCNCRWEASQLKGLLNPCIAAVLIGFLLIAGSVELPGPVPGYLDMLGKIASPLAMLFVGSMLADLKFSHIFTDHVLLKASLIKLIGLPLLVFAVLKGIGLSGLFLSIPVLATAMPAAASTPLLAGKYGNDPYFASKIVFMNTLLSIGTIPLIVLIMR